MLQFLQPAHVAAASIASAGTIVAQSAVQDGVTTTTGWAAGVIAAGVAVFRFMDKRQRESNEQIAATRRADDERTATRIAMLEHQLEAERLAAEQLRAGHATVVRELTERLIALLSDHQTPGDNAQPGPPR